MLIGEATFQLQNMLNIRSVNVNEHKINYNYLICECKKKTIENYTFRCNHPRYIVYIATVEQNML